jgi:hypothetical protein
MSLYEDRDTYRDVVHEQPFDEKVVEIAREMDRLASFGVGHGRMFRMQVAGVLHAARCCGYELMRNRNGKQTETNSRLR